MNGAENIKVEFSNFENNFSDVREENTSNVINDEIKDEHYVDEDYLSQVEPELSELEKNLRREEALELKKSGNFLYQNQQYIESLKMYTQALNLCPLTYTHDRSVLYSNRAAARYKLNDKEYVIRDCNDSIKQNPKYVKAYLRRGKCYEDIDKLDEALEDYKKVCELDWSVAEAQGAVLRLSEKINERNEKLKAEMFKTLKGVGNLLLRPFGLSTDNFEVVPNPNGSCSINFKQ